MLALFALAVIWLNARALSDEAILLSSIAIIASLTLLGFAVRDMWQGRVSRLNIGLVLFAAAVMGATILSAIDCVVRHQHVVARMRSANALKTLDRAMLKYAQAHGHFPPVAICDKAGRPLLSWRVLLLPYLSEEGEVEPGLFKQFRLAEPWDSAHNRQLLQKMPAIYAPPPWVTGPPHSTCYQVFHGKGAAFEGTEGICLTDFPDGRDKTILIVEADAAVPWTQPRDLEYASQAPLPALGGIYALGFNAAFADGHIEFIYNDTPAEQVRAAITRNGGEKLDLH